MYPNKDHSIAHLTATLNRVLNDSVFWTNRLSQRFNDPFTNICLILDESAVWTNRLNERLNDSLNKTAFALTIDKPIKFVQNFFFKSVQTHFNFYSGVTYIQNFNFYDSSLVIKKKCKFFFSSVFSPLHPVAYSRPPGRVSAPPRGAIFFFTGW